MNSRPNVILITTDQQRTDSLSCYGSSFTSTPHLDRMASEGALFERAYCANPVCTPSRASIFGGRYPSRHGAWNVGMNVPDSEVLLSHRLAAAGYRTYYIGKAHFQAFGSSDALSLESVQENYHYPAFRGPYYGFETVELALGQVTYGIRTGHYAEWVRSQVSAQEYESYQSAAPLSEFRFGGEAYDWSLPTRLHNSVWTAERVLDFLKQQDGTQPFFLAIGFQDPHDPHGVPMDYPKIDLERVPLPDFVEGELDDKPPHFREAHRGMLEQSRMRGEFWIAGQGPGADFSRVSARDARLGRAYYYSMVRLIDDQIGHILASLDSLGLADSTLVILTTDHGELLGDHGLWMKGPFQYEQLVRVPLIMRWPAGFAAGQRPDALCSLVDIVPTVLAAGGLPVPAELDGVNALPMLHGETTRLHEAVLVECVDDPRGLRLKSVICTDRKLTWYCGQDYGELYDLARDPHELENRWDDARYATDRAQLLAGILELMEPLEPRVDRLSYA